MYNRWLSRACSLTSSSQLPISASPSPPCLKICAADPGQIYIAIVWREQPIAPCDLITWGGRAPCFRMLANADPAVDAETMASALRTDPRGASHCEAVAKAIHLLGVDGVNLEAALEQRLDHRSMRRLDRNVDLTGIGSTAHFQQPTAHLGEPFASMLEDLLTNFASFAIRQKHMILNPAVER